MMRVLDLFSGIGGFTLGLERTGGFKTQAFCETDGYCRKVLAKHWPGVPIYGDIRQLTGERLRADGIIPDVLCGGFPCQDVSLAGTGAGLAGERSGLWVEFARLIGEVRPKFAIVENVAGLLARGLDEVLASLAALGFDAEWHCIPASAIGAPHRRDRIWIVAHTQRGELRQQPGRRNGPCRAGAAEPADDGEQRAVADADVEPGQQGWPDHAEEGTRGRDTDRGGVGSDVADAGSAGLSLSECPALLGTRWWDERRATAAGGWWGAEPGVGRVAYGIPARVHRLRALGNSVVPQIPELIGRAILEHEGRP